MWDFISVAAFLLLYSLKHRRQLQLLPALAEAASVFVFLYAIAASLLTLVDSYTHLLSTALAAIALLLPADRVPDPRRRLGRRQAWIFAAVLVVLLPFVVGRSDYLRLGADAGVYTNVAKNLLASGGTRFTPKVVRHLEEGWDAYPWLEADGLYRTQSGQLYYQFLPGWPAVLALGTRIFGAADYSSMLTVLALLIGFWIFDALRHWLDGWRLFAGTCCLTLNPVFVYFSKYPTTEIFFLLSTSFALAMLAGRYRRRWVLSAVALGAAATTHISMFFYSPLLVIYAFSASRTDDRRSFLHATFLSLLFAIHLLLSYFFSPAYYRDTFSKFAFFAPNLPFWGYPLGLVLLLTAVLLLLNHWRGRLARIDLSRLIVVFPLWLCLLLIYSIWTGYQFAYTDSPVFLLTGDTIRVAGTPRALYVNRGVYSLVHLLIFNLALATGVSFLLAFIYLTLDWRRRTVSDKTDLFLLCSILFPLSFYSLILPDLRANYFQSRYLLPVVVLCLLVLVLKRAATWGPAWFWLLTGVALSWNLFYSSFIARVPERPGRRALVHHLVERIPRGEPVLTVGRAWGVHLLFANLAIYDLHSPYAYLGEACQGGSHRLLRYIQEQSPTRLFVISESQLPLTGAYSTGEEILVTDNRYVYWSNILYPYRYRSADERYYLYVLRQPKELLPVGRELTAQQIQLLSPCSYWTNAGDWSNGVFALSLLRPIQNVSRLRLETGGRLLSQLLAREGSDLRVSATIDGVELEQPLSRTIVFDLPEPRTVTYLEIRSPTFVPAELGINADRRRLGLDLERIVFE